jgi:hypothetical protein
MEKGKMIIKRIVALFSQQPDYRAQLEQAQKEIQVLKAELEAQRKTDVEPRPC